MPACSETHQNVVAVAAHRPEQYSLPEPSAGPLALADATRKHYAESCSLTESSRDVGCESPYGPNEDRREIRDQSIGRIAASIYLIRGAEGDDRFRSSSSVLVETRVLVHRNLAKLKRVHISRTRIRTGAVNALPLRAYVGDPLPLVKEHVPRRQACFVHVSQPASYVEHLLS